MNESNDDNEIKFQESVKDDQGSGSRFPIRNRVMEELALDHHHNPLSPNS